MFHMADSYRQEGYSSPSLRPQLVTKSVTHVVMNSSLVDEYNDPVNVV